MAERKQYPKMVYGPGNEQVIINGPDELPEGFMTFREKHRKSGSMSDASLDAAMGAIITADGVASSKAAAEDAQAARDAANKAAQDVKDAHEAQAHRDRIKAYLTENNVDFVPQMGTPKLEELAAKLREHLAEQDANDASQ